MNCPRCHKENTSDSRFCSACGAEIYPGTPVQPAPTMTFQTPTKGFTRGTVLAGRFEVLEEIGHGGMGTVYKVYDPRIDEVLAVKVLKPEISSDLNTVERFRNEIRLARKVAHRNVCRMYDLGESGLTVYITMEFVPGEDLKSFIKRSKVITETKVLDLAGQIAEGLQEAHRLGIIHRDLKPQNIMIDRDGNAKIMDFGIARSMGTMGRTATGVIIGTPEYMAPEQADGREADQRTDIYALGAIMFEMATGRLPFEGDTPLSIVLKHKSERPAVPSSVNSQLSQKLSRIILKCLEKDPAKRYATAAQLLEDLGRTVPGQSTGESTLTAPAKTPSREITLKLTPRKFFLPLIVILGIVGILFLLTMVEKMLSRGGREPDGRTPSQALRTSANPSSSIPPPPPVASEGIPKEIAWLSKFSEKNSPISPDEAKKVYSIIGKLRADYPAFAKLLDDIQSKLDEMVKLQAAGDKEGTRKAMNKSGSDMNKLLSLVAERDRAESAFRSLSDTRKRTVKNVNGKPSNLLSWIALEKEKDATEAFRKNDFSGARILYEILEKVHSLSTSVTDDESCLASLRKYVDAIGDEADTAGVPKKEEWLYSRAYQEEDKANELLKKKQYPLAAEQYILAAFLYRKATEVVAEGARVIE